MRPERRNQALGRRLILAIIVANALLSLVASSIQLYTSYQRDKSEVRQSIARLDDSFRLGFEDALWEYNDPLVQALLQGIQTEPDVARVELVATSGETWMLGQDKFTGLDKHVLTFSRERSNGIRTPLGTLSVYLTFQNATARVWSQFWTLMISNFAKTVCASIFMLMIFNKAIGQHLVRISQHVRSIQIGEESPKLGLLRRASKEPDDLDEIVNAINAAAKRSAEDMEKLQGEIAQRRDTENKLREYTDRLHDMNREQSEFTFAISHDLKSPTNTIRMLLEELRLQSCERLTVDDHALLDDIAATTNRMTKLVEDVLEYARTLNETLDMEPVDTNQMFRDIRDDLRSEIIASEAVVEVADLPKLFGNPTQLRMLFQNAIANAIKFRAENRPPKIKVEATNESNIDHVVITIRDNGIGVSEQYHDKVFGLFQRLHSHDSYEGSGIGLTLCRRIATNHNGHISLKSDGDRGTLVTVSLPREQ